MKRNRAASDRIEEIAVGAFYIAHHPDKTYEWKPPLNDDDKELLNRMLKEIKETEAEWDKKGIRGQWDIPSDFSNI